MRLKNYDADDPRKAVTKEFEITINEANEEALYLKGIDEIKLDRYSTYMLVNEDTDTPVVNAVEFSIENVLSEDKNDDGKPLATIMPAYDENNNIIPYAYVVHANARNKLGKVILTATYGGQTYTKTIKIVPLW